MSVALGLSAAGIDQATAYDITLTAGTAQFSTVAAGQGCNLPVIAPSQTLCVRNDGVSALTVYPSLQGTIASHTINGAASILIMPNNAVIFTCAEPSFAQVFNADGSLVSRTGPVLTYFAEAAIPLPSVKVIAANTILTLQDADSIIALDDAGGADYTITLPDITAAAGLRYKFIATTSNAAMARKATITSAAPNLIVGTAIVAKSTAMDAILVSKKTSVSFAKNVALNGDTLTLTSATGEWYLEGFTQDAAGITSA